MSIEKMRIVSSNDLKQRSYVIFYQNGKRYREYNGKNLALDIKPNLATTIEERDKLLRKLCFELQVALENNDYPRKPKNEIVEKKLSAGELLENAINIKLSQKLNKTYKWNLEWVYHKFTQFLTPDELDGDISNIKVARISKFLEQFNSSGTYYMNKRRDLNVLFSTAGKQLNIPINSVLKTDRQKAKAKLHKIYSQEQVKGVLNFLEKNHPKLHLCCLLTYSTLLRPHEEIRLLTPAHFKKNCSEIHLSGEENKSGRVRVTFVPEYLQKKLIPLIDGIRPNANIFTKLIAPHNDNYFGTAWQKMFRRMIALGIIEKNQTIYSFRHTAAVSIYQKTKDLHILQKLLGHSDMIVTLKYLRGLGEVGEDNIRDVLPIL